MSTEFEPRKPHGRRYGHPVLRPAYLQVDNKGLVHLTVEAVDGLLLLAGYTRTEETHHAADLISVEPS